MIEQHMQPLHVNSDNQNDVQQPLYNLEDIANVIFDTDKINVRTNLTANQIIYLAIGKIFATEYDIEVMHTFINEVKEGRISLNGNSRKELVRIFQAVIAKEPQLPIEEPTNAKQESGLRRLIGLR